MPAFFFEFQNWELCKFLKELCNTLSVVYNHLYSMKIIEQLTAVYIH
jgi:hypothetical protein